MVKTVVVHVVWLSSCLKHEKIILGLAVGQLNSRQLWHWSWPLQTGVSPAPSENQPKQPVCLGLRFILGFSVLGTAFRIAVRMSWHGRNCRPCDSTQPHNAGRAETERRSFRTDSSRRLRSRRQSERQRRHRMGQQVVGAKNSERLRVPQVRPLRSFHECTWK